MAIRLICPMLLSIIDLHQKTEKKLFYEYLRSFPNLMSEHLRDEIFERDLRTTAMRSRSRTSGVQRERRGNNEEQIKA